MSIRARNGGKPRKKHYTDYERWVGLPHFMLKTTNWKSMSPNAKALLIEVWARYNGINNGEISYSVREAKQIGLGRNMAGRAFQELIDRGFLCVGRDSAFTVKCRLARAWLLTAMPMPDGTPATKNYMTKQNVPPKNKTQSRQGDAKSRHRDREPGIETKEPLTVTPKGLSRANSTPSQSRQWDTSNYHGDRQCNTKSAGSATIVHPNPAVTIINGVVCTYGNLFDRDYGPTHLRAAA